MALEPGLLKSVLAWRVLATLILCRGDAGLSPEGGGVMLAVLSPQVRRGCDAGSAEPSPVLSSPPFLLTAFKPVDLSDLKRRNTQDAKKS